MAIAYTETKLWQRTLGRSSSAGAEESGLERLRTAFETAHQRIIPIVRQAHIDCHGLTIHDETHLDALWQVADIIMGENYPITPIEAFVFGCSVLFHDSALSVCAYEGGLAALRGTAEWQRALHAMTGKESVADTDLNEPEAKIAEQAALFSTLRALHGQQALTVSEREWINPKSGASLFIIDNTSLRDYYSQIIGRIAASHHWDIDRVAREFSVSKAPPPDFPPEWTLNELKVACLLRCADAAHIDERRAPLMEYAIINPKGISNSHWLFQSRLGVPSKGDHSIVFSSGRDFGRSEAEAWWLCYDTCRMISRELQDSNAVLKEHGTPTFFANRVEGIQRPKLFAKYVRCDGWEPVDAEVRVSDPVHLAQTLGGRNLYGHGVQAPVRELIQNAVDATLLRASIGREGYKPLIRVTIERGEGDQLQLAVEDNGIGMSERVLTRRLLDFGRSGWKSDDVAQDNPEIRPTQVSVSGKFGIGFFAVFLVGDEVTVVTRRYKDGIADALALEFVGLARRPILRKALEEEQSDAFTTKVVVRASAPSVISGLLPRDRKRRLTPPDSSYGRRALLDFFSYLRWLLVSCEVDVDLVDKVGSRSFHHRAQWSSRSSEEFLKDVAVGYRYEDPHEDPQQFSGLVSPLKSDEGHIVGRAAVKLGNKMSTNDLGFARVGGLTYPAPSGRRIGAANTTVVPPYIGIMPGEVGIATRGQAQISISAEMLAIWATDQADLGLSHPLATMERIELARHVYWAGGDPKALPIAFLGGSLVSLATLREILFKRQSLFMPVSVNQQVSEANWLSISDLKVRFFTDKLSSDVCMMAVRERQTAYSRGQNSEEIALQYDIELDEEARSRFHPGPFDIVLDLIEKAGRTHSIRFERREVFQTGLTATRFRAGFLVTLDP